MKEIPLRVACNNGVYTFPSTLLPNKVAFMHERTSIDGWHKCLDHPSFKLVHSFVNRFSLPVMSHHVSSLCSFALSIKYINFLFEQPVFTVMPFSILYTWMFGEHLHTLVLMVLDTTYYLLIITRNTCVISHNTQI